MNIKLPNKALFIFLSIFSVYIFLLTSDILPIIRGPHDSNLPSQWPYYLVNTFDKSWIFLPIYAGFVFLFVRFGKLRQINKKNEIISIIILVLLTTSFQLAIVYFSRFGITVLFRRLVDPGINGYFTTGVQIDNIWVFLKSFPDYVNAKILYQHASGHPPGSVLFIKLILDLFALIPSSLLSFINTIHPGWANDLWNSLTIHEKFTSLVLPFILHLISSLVVIPFYFVAKELMGDSKSALKTTLLYSVIPSLSFFALIFDPIYALFPLLSTLFILMGIRKKTGKYFYLAGLSCGIGLFFTAAILTYLMGLLIYVILSYKTVLVEWVTKFILGIIIIVFILYLSGFNLISSLFAVIHNQAPREYVVWLIYNPFDFFAFMGFPLSILFIYQTWHVIRHSEFTSKTWKNLFYTFWITFILLVFSGASRGEVGRIWLPFMFLPLILVSNFLVRSLKFTTYHFVIIFTLIFIQVILLEEFWVPIW